VLLERSWWVGFNGIYLVSFGFRMWEILIFKWFLLLKIQINSKKPGFFGRKKISWRHDNTWRLTIQFKHDFLSYLVIQRIRYIHCKTMIACWVSLFHNGFTLGSMAQATLVIMKLWKKWDDYVKIKLHLNGNIEWHCMQLEFKFHANQFKFNWRETKGKLMQKV